MKLNFISWIFLFISLSVLFFNGLADDKAVPIEPQYHGIRAERGIIKDTLRSAAASAVATKIMGGSARQGAIAGGVTGAAMSAINRGLNRRYKQNY